VSAARVLRRGLAGGALLVAATLLCVHFAGAARAADVLPLGNGGAHRRIPTLEHQLDGLRAAALALPLATVLGAALAFRPRRPGTPPRRPAVIQTQILLAVIGAVVMLVVGQSLARAFGIVGAASLIRYRAKIDDPKDAGVMLATLGLGLAAGVGLYAIALFAAAFLLGLLWCVEAMEPPAMKRFLLSVTAKQPGELRARLERVLRRNEAVYELRSSTAEQLCYDVSLPFDRRTDTVSNAIAAIDASEETSVEWEEKKPA